MVLTDYILHNFYMVVGMDFQETDGSISIQHPKKRMFEMNIFWQTG